MATGLGQDGYLRVQRETTYNTPATNAMTLLPISSGLLKGYSERIENTNIIASRLKQAFNQGRKIRNGEIMLNIPPTLVGLIFNFFGGLSVNTTIETGTYSHYWLAPKTGERIPTSFTLQQAVGADLADQFSGVMINKLTIAGEAVNNLTLSAELVGKGLTEDVARISSFSYPAQAPYSTCMTAVSITPSGGSPITVDMNKFSIELNMNYDMERFKIGSCEIAQPVFKSIPTATASVTIDADKTFLTAARAYTTFSVSFTVTHTTLAGATEPFSFKIELPGCQISPDVEIPNDNDRISMDLAFECGFGGNTTNGTSVMWEIYNVDTVATYPAS